MKTKPDTLEQKVAAYYRSQQRVKRAYKQQDQLLIEILKEREPGDVLAVKMGKKEFKFVVKDEFPSGVIQVFRAKKFTRYSLELVK